MMEMLMKAEVHMKEEVNESNVVMILDTAKLKCEDPWQNNINNALKSTLVCKIC
jgi:hypothetical protein